MARTRKRTCDVTGLHTSENNFYRKTNRHFARCVKLTSIYTAPSEQNMIVALDLRRSIIDHILTFNLVLTFVKSLQKPFLIKYASESDFAMSKLDLNVKI